MFEKAFSCFSLDLGGKLKFASPMEVGL